MKVLIADDHALFREGLRYVLDALSRSLTVLDAANGQQALSLVDRHEDLDLLLLDLSMPGMHGFDTLELLGQRYPALPVVILSASSHPRDVQRALNAGAMGFIPKSYTAAAMIGALQLVLSGHAYVPPEMFSNTASARQSRHNNEGKKTLTRRQLDVLSLMQRGQPNKLIAAQLGLAESTVKMHVTAILKTLSVTNRTQAAVALEHTDQRRSLPTVVANDAACRHFGRRS
jgi:DNA-binding NarL/FixJ family response regulator